MGRINNYKLKSKNSFKEHFIKKREDILEAIHAMIKVIDIIKQIIKEEGMNIMEEITIIMEGQVIEMDHH